jgi:succinyl-CoA synthetase beta subunit
VRAIGAVAKAVPNGGGWLSEHASKELLRRAGVPVVDGRLVTDVAGATQALADLGGPVAMKVSSASVQHKSELGAVEVGLATELAVRASFARLAAVASAHDGEVLVERMAEPGVELLVAARRFPVASVLVIGLGGVWTELLDDLVIVPLPADGGRIERALRSLRGAALLTGGRGREPVDIAAASRLIERCGQVLIEQRLDLVELNPVLVTPGGAVAVDAAIGR